MENEWVSNCPLCGHKLVHRSGGYVCKNWKCQMYWKLGVGPVWRGPKLGWQIKVWQPYSVPNKRRS